MDEKQLKKDFGNRIRYIRKQKKLTQEILSEIADIDPQHYCKIENGTHFPSPKNIINIAEALQVNIQDLFLFNNNNELLDKILISMRKLTNQELAFIYATINELLKLR